MRPTAEVPPQNPQQLVEWNLRVLRLRKNPQAAKQAFVAVHFSAQALDPGIAGGLCENKGEGGADGFGGRIPRLWRRGADDSHWSDVDDRLFRCWCRRLRRSFPRRGRGTHLRLLVILVRKNFLR